MTDREVMQQALEALESSRVFVTTREKIKYPEGTEWYDERITALRERLAQPEQESVNKYCCHLCFNKSGQMFLDRMILCPECGNKRCPKATHHELPCTNSNEPGQPGSIYTRPQARVFESVAA